MAGLVSTAAIPFVGLFALLAAAALQTVAVASPYWVHDSFGDFGLWRRAACRGQEIRGVVGCRAWDLHWDVNDWLLWTRGLACSAVLLFALPLVSLPIYLYVSLGLWWRRCLTLVTMLVFAGTVCSGLSMMVAIFEVVDQDSFSYGWAVWCVGAGCGLGFLSSIAFLIAACSRPHFTAAQHPMSGFYASESKDCLYVVEAPPMVHPSHVNLGLPE